MLSEDDRPSTADASSTIALSDHRRALLLPVMAKVAAGDRAAFAQLYRETSGILLHVARRILPEGGEAEEAVQEAYLTVWRKAVAFDPTRGHAMTWLMTIARNSAIDRLRARRRVSTAPIDDAQAVADPGESAFGRLVETQERNRLAVCMEDLERRDVDFLRAAFFEGSSYVELAARASLPLPTVKSRVRRALLKLRACLA